MRQVIAALVGLFVIAACTSTPGTPSGSSTPTRVPLLPASESTPKPALPPVSVPALPTEVPATDEPLATLEVPSPTSSTAAETWTDDFSDSTSGWDVNSVQQGSVGYQDEAYIIQVDQTNYSLWANPGRKFEDVAVSVQAQPLDKSVPSDMGVICRYDGVNNFIYGAITSDGYYGIYQVKNGDFKLLSGNGKLRASDAIQQSGSTNKIELQCAGNQFSLSANDQQLATVEADMAASGDVGVIAGTYDKPHARVRFDDFVADPAGLAGSNSPRGNGDILTDDFSNPKSGWDTRKTENGESGYRNGQYFIRVDKPKYQLWSTAGQNFPGSVVVDVTAGLVSGPQENELGVVCRYQDRDNFIYASIGSDGYYAIVEIKDGKSRILTGDGKFQQSADIPVGSKTYDLRLACEDNRYTLSVNGQEIVSASSDAFSQGDVGLLAGTFDQGGVVAVFDDFTATPADLTSPASSAGGSTLFVDDFSDPKSGWAERKSDSGTNSYRNGQYFIRVDKPKYQIWATAGQSFSGDVVVAVTAGAIAGPQDNEMGVVCRYRDGDNFMYASIDSNGYYAISEEVNGKASILTGNGQYQQSADIPAGSGTYQIQFACEGDRYTLSVNGQKIDSAQSQAFSTGDVGLLAGTFDQGGVEIAFDDFSVSQP